MKIINKYSLFFLIIVTGLFLASLQISNSKHFNSLIQKRISSYIKKLYKFDIEFERMDLGFFPPSTKFYNVRLYELKKDKKVKVVNSDEVIIKFSYLDFFRSKLIVDTISISNGLINYNILGTENKTKLKKDLDIKVIYQVYSQNKIKFKVRSIALENIDLNIGRDKTYIKNANISLYEKTFNIKALLEKFNISSYKEIHQIDSLLLDIEFDSDKVRVKNMSIYKGINNYQCNGYIYQDGSNYVYNGKFRFIGQLNDMLAISNIKSNIVKGNSGYLDVEAYFEGKNKNFNIKSNLEINKFKGELGEFSKIITNLRIKDNFLIVDKMEIYKDKSYIKLTKPITILNIDKMKLVYGKLSVSLRDMHTNDILYLLKNLNNMKGIMTGNVDIELTKNNVTFMLHDNFKIKDFKLFSPDNQVILENSNIFINNGKILYQLNKNVTLDMVIKFSNSYFHGIATFDNDKMNFYTKKSNVNLKELGPIFGLQLYGNGILNTNISGNYDNLKYIFIPKMKNFSIFNYNLGNIDAKVSIGQDLVLNIENGICNYRSTSFIIDGFFKFGKSKNYQLNFDIKKGNSRDIKYLLKPLLTYNKALKSFVDISYFNYRANFMLNGNLRTNNISVNGRYYSDKVSLFEESIGKVGFDFKLNNQKLVLDNINIRKSLGSIVGDISIDMINKINNYNFKFDNIYLRSFYYYNKFNMGYDGEIYGFFNMSSSPNSFKIDSNLNIRNSMLGDESVDDSSISITSNKNNINIKGNFIKDMVTIDSNIKNKRYISFKSNFNVYIYNLMSIFSNHNLKNDEIGGQLNGSLIFDLDLKNWKRLNLSFMLDNLFLEKGDLRLNLNKGKDSILIENGIIKKWNILLSGRYDKVLSQAYGNMYSKFNLSQLIDSNASFLELFYSKISGVRGRILVNHKLTVNNGNILNKIFSNSKGFSFKLDFINSSFSSIDYDIIIDNRDLFINNFSGIVGDGTIYISGNVFLNIPYPKLSLRGKLRSTEFLFLKRTKMKVSGDLNFSGYGIPYNLYGNINIENGIIGDAIKDIRSEFGISESYKKFIPSIRTASLNKAYIKNDLKLKLENGISIKNNILDLKLKGQCYIKGQSDNNLINGTISIIPNTSKFLFRGNKFFIKRGSIDFVDKIRKEIPIVDFSGSTTIGDYNIILNVNGPVSNVRIDLSSEPSLPKNDILSLLTLGVTSDVSKSLDEKDQQSLVTLGLGNLLIDQLKISEGIGKTFGVRVSVLPEFVKEDRSLLEGRSRDSQSSSNLKTSTKVKVQNQIAKDVDLSFSSTISKGSDQKQEVNINYNIDKHWGFEGIYETNTSDVDESATSESLGFDIKYKWSF